MTGGKLELSHQHLSGVDYIKSRLVAIRMFSINDATNMKQLVDMSAARKSLANLSKGQSSLKLALSATLLVLVYLTSENEALSKLSLFVPQPHLR